MSRHGVNMAADVGDGRRRALMQLGCIVSVDTMRWPQIPRQSESNAALNASSAQPALLRVRVAERNSSSWRMRADQFSCQGRGLPLAEIASTSKFSNGRPFGGPKK